MKKLTKYISLIIIVCLFYTSVPMISSFADIDNGYTVKAATAGNVVSTSEKVKVTESGLRMRASYSTSSAIMGKVTKGNTYQLKAKTTDGKWGQLSTNGYWIYLSYTTPVTDTSSGSSGSSGSATGSNIVATSEKVKVTESGLRMRASYSTSSAIMGKVTKGNTYQLKAKTTDGKWGQLSTNGYWIYLSYTTPVTSASSGSSTSGNVVAVSENVKVTASGLRMRASYSTSSAIKGTATKGKVYQLKAKTTDGKWGQLSTNGYWIYLSYTVPYNPTATDIVNSGGAATGVCTGQDVVNYAVQFVGNPYKWGGTSLTDGADCSGFVQSVYAHFGIQLPRTTDSQATVGKSVSYSKIKPGDIVCYSKHVAIYIGDGKIVHASTPKTGIKISNDPKYKPIISIRRIVE